MIDAPLASRLSRYMADGPSAADAWQLGYEARGAGKALKAVPPEWRTREFQTYADAWADGWRASDEEMAAALKT